MTAALRLSSKTLDALWTWDDLVAMPDDGNQYEIIDGELYSMPPPVPDHQIASGSLFAEFRAHVRARKLGMVLAAPIGVRLGEHDIVEPDIIFIAKERLGIIGRALIEGPPDIVVEILSPSPRSKDLNEKAALYARAGVRAYWQVDLRYRTVVILVLRHGVYEPAEQEAGVARSTVLPEFAVDVAAMFEELSTP